MEKENKVSTGLMMFGIGIAAGLITNFLARKAARKVIDFKFFPKDWYKSSDFEHW